MRKALGGITTSASMIMVEDIRQLIFTHTSLLSMEILECTFHSTRSLHYSHTTGFNVPRQPVLSLPDLGNGRVSAAHRTLFTTHSSCPDNWFRWL